MPRSLGIIGAGAVGVEFASIFNRFGSKVTVLEMLPRLVPVEDEDVSKELERYFKKTGIRVGDGSQGREYSAKCEQCQSYRDSRKRQERRNGVRQAAGGGWAKAEYRQHRIENTSVRTGPRFRQCGRVSAHGRTQCYAIGDIVAGTPQLAHVATMEGMVAVAHMAGKPARPINRNRIPGCTYTEPGIGSVGLTEAQAKAQGFDVKVGKFPFVGNSKATILGTMKGL